MNRKIVWAFLWLLLGSPYAWAHKPSDSYLTLSATPNSSEISLRWDIALRDLDYVLQLDQDNNGQLNWGEVSQRSQAIEQYAQSRLVVGTKEAPCTWQNKQAMALDKHSDGTYAVLRATLQCASLTDNVPVHYSLFFDVDPTHRGLVQWSADGLQSSARVFSATTAEQALARTPPSTWETVRQYIAEGAWHIWIGFDHILFLLALLLPAVLIRRASGTTDFLDIAKDVLKVVTAFTVAHSITLSLAALQIISLPSRWVESAIAASVVLAALNNLRRQTHQPGRARWLMAFVFGLIHGFGFASVLADLGLPQQALVLALVAFNVGVELGQLAIVAAFLPIAYALRKTAFYQVGVLRAGSVAIALLAAYWLAQRVFDL
jgi:hypothetical protein